MTRDRAEVSKIVVAVAVIGTLVVAAGAFVLLDRGSTSSSLCSAAAGTPSVPVSSAVDELVQDVNETNVDGLATFYCSNAVVVWSGATGGLSGRYEGAENIRLIYATTVGKTTQMDVNVSKYAEDAFSPTNVNATFMLDMLANSTEAGKVTARIDVSQEWNWGSQGWQITREDWAYTYFDSSYIDLNQAPSTTFPQWAVMREGGNPNLVSEKSFEWHAGPYVAASVYAFLFGVAAILALRLGYMRRDEAPDERKGSKHPPE
jgi:hypothetical protein